VHPYQNPQKGLPGSEIADLESAKGYLCDKISDKVLSRERCDHKIPMFLPVSYGIAQDRW
jgi:hypothetical protein